MMEGRGPSVPPYGLLGAAGPGHGPFLYGSWGKRDGLFVAPQGLNYLELCRALLSQVNPGLAPRLRKTHTKECGVQVNAKVDKVTQCSLGPKTLYTEESDPPDPAKGYGIKSPGASTPGGKAFHTPVNGVRFFRPVSIYSPVFDRRVCFKSKCDGDAGCEVRCRASPGEESEVDAEEDAPADAEEALLHQALKESNFQFLEQRYGFFHCRECNIRWESAYVWCISGTSKVYFKQLCRKCQVGFNPYKVESILCKVCAQTSCCCEKKQRHTNMRRPHRQDLCCRCKGTRLSCDATYSFKYIV